MYRQYISVEYDDSNDVKILSEKLHNKKVFVICPGSSLVEYKEKIINTLEEEKNSVSISVNFIPDFLKMDFVFCANAKRLSNINDKTDISKIITSNLIEQSKEKYNLVFSFNNCVYFNEEFCEDSTLMLLKILNNCGCKDVYLIGFDGFDSKGHNYYSNTYTKEEGKNISVKTVKQIISSFDKIKLHFITPSLYEI